MRFSSAGIQRRSSRKIGRKSVSAQAEPCELRSLLSASVISVGAIDGSDLPMDGGEDSAAKVDTTEIDSLLGAPIDPEFAEIMPGDPGVDDAIFYGGIADGDTEIPAEDPLAFIRFNTLFTSDESGIDGEKPVFDEEVILEDAPPSEGWDPSWLYRTLTPGEGDGSEEIIVDQGTGWEDGLGCGVSPEGFVPGDVPIDDVDGDGMPDDFVINAFDPLPLDQLGEDGLGCGVAPDGFVPGDVPSNDVDGDGLPDDFVMSPFDPLPLEDGSGKPVDVITDDGGNAEPDGEVAVEVEAPASDPNENEEVHYALDPLPLDDTSGEPVDVWADGELIPIRTLESSDFDPSVIFYTAAPGGVEVQRTNDAGNVQEESVAPSTVAIPVRPSSSTSLFNANSGRSSVGIPAGVQSNLTPGSISSPTKRNATQRRSTTLVAATRQSAASEGLNSLSPLLGDDEAPSRNDSPENSVDTQAVESESIEETVSDNGNASSGASGFAANQNIRRSRAAMIDRVMAQYAENSFNS